MTAFNVVRFRVKPGRDQEFIDAHEDADPEFEGMRKFSLFSTGPGTYCIVGEWESMDHLATARPDMIGMLDSFRHLLEDMGEGLGVTDPISGPVVVERAPAKKRKTKAKKKAAKPAKKKAAKKPAKKSAKRKKKR
jgi:quinol monooxygenase YgiN